MQEQVQNKSLDQFLKTDGGKTESNAIDIPAIALPTGGGAIKGIDEKFSVNTINGTASFSIPLPFAQARGVSPALSLSYNSGSGNGPFGLGWNLNLSGIQRKTDGGLPQYIDEVDSDVFLFSEAEDLVPEFQKMPDGSFAVAANGEYVIKEKDTLDDLYRIRFYKPRIEGLFARIERWTEKSSGVIKWKITTRENITTLFGWSDLAVIADPKNPRKIYKWLPEFVYDDKGNCAQYLYKKEDEIGFDLSLPHNRNRYKNGTITYTNLYLEKIAYGNKTPFQQISNGFPLEADYVFQSVFDYGAYNDEAPYDQSTVWDYRPDAFSDYKAGFELRTTRLCKRVLLFHFFDELPGGFALVKSSDFEYDTTSEKGFTYLKSITNYGYIKNANGSYTDKAFPALEFEYQAHEWNRSIKHIAKEDCIHAPIGLDGQVYQFTDLYNEGLAGILSEQANGWYYKHNLGSGKFEAATLVSPKPTFVGLGHRLQLADLDADGTKQLVHLNSEPKGYFELDDEDKWQAFRSFHQMPNLDVDDPNIRFLDLNGDGKADILMTEDQLFSWYPSEGRKGFASAKQTIKHYDEEAGPQLVFSDQQQSIFTADMSGDGMTDLIRIRNAEICYWPNLGYGRFGTKVNMDTAPVFDHPEAFNPRFIQLADIDGSGTTDVIYLGKNQLTCWMNLNGNSFKPTPFEIKHFPDIHHQARISVTDLLGNGVACIVWSGTLPADDPSPLRYIDLMNSKKPHLMVAYKNNLGKEIALEYTPSTQFYIEDKLAGTPWITKLHFPVHCISKSETIDKISGWRFSTSYKYHHGYYDHQEREFRGFGMVEKIDAEHFEHWEKGNATNVVNRDLHQEPVISKLWFHTGAFLNKEKILNQYQNEYWHEVLNKQGFAVSHQEANLPDAKLIPALGMSNEIIEELAVAEWREAFRACKNRLIRSEAFAYDAPLIAPSPDEIKQQLTPYSVATNNCVIELLQPKGKNRHAIFIVKEREAITYSYERNTADPRIAHNLNIKLDEYANVLESVSVVYPRLVADASLLAATKLEQSKPIIVYTQNEFTNDVLQGDNHLLRLPSEVKTYEIKGLTPTGFFYTLSDFENILDTATPLFYHQVNVNPPPDTIQKRLVEHSRTNYYRNDLSGPLLLHQLESLAIPYESYQLAYTPELIADIFDAKVNAALLTEGQFTNSEGDDNWWVRSGTTQFLEIGETAVDARNRFYTALVYIDPYGAKTKVKYFNPYFQFVEETEDALGNKSVVEVFDFRTLSPQRTRDINNNISEIIYDELGQVKATALLGKGNEADDLLGLSAATTPDETAAILAYFNQSKTPEGITDSDALIGKAKTLLQHATVRYLYDLDAYRLLGKPVGSAMIRREKHFQDDQDASLQLSFEYSNGLGNVILKKAQAEPGPAKQVTLNPDDTYQINPIDTAMTNQLRWIGSGRTILNNKGNVVKQYEPYFSVNHEFEAVKELVETGVSPISYYDALNRLVKVEMPDGTFSKTVFDAWKEAIHDASDTILESSWYLNRTNRLIDAELLAEGKNPALEKVAADKAAVHANTPTVVHYDTLGRWILSIEHNKNISSNADEFYATKVQLDAEGNLLKVVDARELLENQFKGNTVVTYKYDLLGNPVYRNSMDSGQRWLLTNILGSPLRTWDERNYEFQFFYDVLQRPTWSKVIGGTATEALDHIFDRVIYGESLLLPNRTNEAALQAINVLGKPIKHFDTGGVLLTPEYNFKEQAISTGRRLFKYYKTVANWIDANLESALEAETITLVTEMDALNRIIQQNTPDGSILTLSYNEAGLLDRKTLIHLDAALSRTYIKNISYNEKGQREKITYGNDVTTTFYYDKTTFRLKRLESKRQNNEPLQDWFYTFDPVGNITHVEDKNIPTVFFNNQKITGVSTYTYDALYRLVEATGRENTAPLFFDNYDNCNDAPFLRNIDPGSAIEQRGYTQCYQYDEVGNILQMQHKAMDNNWTRDYIYENNNNRLRQTDIGSLTYNYNYHPQHGFISAMPHLASMSWNFKEELVKTIAQKVNVGNGTPETTYYQYDGQGQRIRKITEHQTPANMVPTKKEERIYIGVYELYKKHSGEFTGLERVSLNLMDAGFRFAILESRNEIDDGTEKRLVRYQLYNQLGSTALELDQQTRIITYEAYHPFGTTAYQAKNTAIKSAAKRYRFTNMERDEETGLSYHSARYYLPWLGRWLSPDPIGLEGGINAYRYSSNQPITRVDPAGTADKSGHDLLTRLIAMQYTDYDNAVKIGRAANLSDMVTSLDATETSLGALPTLLTGIPLIGIIFYHLYRDEASDVATINEGFHALNEQEGSVTRAEISTEFGQDDFSAAGNSDEALERFGVRYFHPFQDSYYHTPDRTNGAVLGHFAQPEADLVTGNMSFEEFRDMFREQSAFMEQALQREELRDFRGEAAINRLTDDELRGLYNDLHAAGRHDEIQRKGNNAFGTYALPFHAGGTVLGGLLAGVGAVTGGVGFIFSLLGLLVGLIVGLIASALTKKDEVHESIKEENKVLTDFITEQTDGAGTIYDEDLLPSDPKPLKRSLDHVF